VLDSPPTLKVHTGFLSQMMSLRSSINQTLANLDFNTLVLSGHSLGGALATIASMHYSTVYPDKKIKLIVFGSPRCGNKAFTDLVNQIVPDHIRVVNSTDPINEYPLCKVYQHISNCLTIKYNGTARLSNNDVNWMQRLFATILYFSLADHFLFNYIDNLKKMI
jgi:predicted lipase